MSANAFQGEISVSHLPYHVDLYQLLNYFEQFGAIDHYHLDKSNSSTGCLYITYQTRECADRCMLNRPHRFRGHYLYVRRSLRQNVDDPREHFLSVRDLLVTAEPAPSADDEQFLRDLREYFSVYGPLYACKYCAETTRSNHILIEFADYDQVDQIILDRPHYLRHYHLNVRKSSASTRFDVGDEVDLDQSHRTEDELESEVERLKQTITQMNEEFYLQRKDLEDHCCEQLRELTEKAEKTHRLQQDLEKEYSQLLSDYENLQSEHRTLQDEYIRAELENFEIRCYYDQLLAEEKSKLLQYEAMCREKCVGRHSVDTPPPIPDDED